MSPILSSQGVVLATAMAAFSGTMILFAFKNHKYPFISHFHFNPNNNVPVLRPCLSSGDKKGEKKKKKVRFAEDVVDTTGNNNLFRRQYSSNSRKSGRDRNKRMQPNRLALYNGILKDRGVYRVTYLY